MKKDKIKLVNKISLLVFFSVILYVSISWAETLVVSKDSLQYPTIQSAIDAAKSGDVVFVKAGEEYVENVIMKEGVDLLGSGRGNTIISGTVKGASNTKFKHFTVTKNSPILPLLIGASGMEIKSNDFAATSVNKPIYTAISLSGGEFVNNSVKVEGSNTITAVNASGALCAHNNIKSSGTGIAGGGTIVNNAIVAPTPISGGSGRYNLLSGGGVGDAGNGNLTDVAENIFDDPASGLKPSALGIDAADPTYELYAKGVKSMGTYPDTAGIIMDGDIIQAEINKVIAGDTVYIEPGTYTLTSDLKISKNIILTTTNPNRPEETVIDLNGNCIVIMDETYYKGTRRYSDKGLKSLDNVTIEGFTIKGDSSGAESIFINDIDPATGYGIERWFTNSGIKAPIFNFAKTLTLSNCKILSKNEAGVSIYTWLYTKVNCGSDVKIFYETDVELNIDILSSTEKKLLATNPPPEYVQGPYGLEPGPYGLEPGPEPEKRQSIISGILRRFLATEQPAVEEPVAEEEPPVEEVAEEPEPPSLIVEDVPVEDVPQEPVVEEKIVAKEMQGPYGKVGPYGQIPPKPQESETGTIQGYIHYANGYPVMGMKVVIESDIPYGHYEAKTNNKGYYVIKGVEKYYENELIEYTMGVYRPDTNGLMYQREDPVVLTSDTIVVDIQEIVIRR